ncbi:MAG: AraC family transcriptional regulator [Gorillibacterium sp.]|nr:AraC family transcriptional regulator [Gorillibacterium sp.]
MLRPIEIVRQAYMFQRHGPIFSNYWREGFEVRPHSHDFIEITYIVEGSGYHYLNQETIKVEKGDIFLLPVGTVHVLRPTSADKGSRLVVYNCGVAPDWWEQSFPETLDILQLPLRFRDQQGRLLPLFEAFHREYEGERNNREIMLNAYLAQLVISLYRELRELPTAELAKAPHSSINAAIDYVDEHHLEPLMAKPIARTFGMSLRHFHRLFKETTNQTFNRYVQIKRVESACRLLVSTSYLISEIAARSGYRDLKHFQRVFRSITGTTLQAYRTRALEEADKSPVSKYV